MELNVGDVIKYTIICDDFTRNVVGVISQIIEVSDLYLVLDDIYMPPNEHEWKTTTSVSSYTASRTNTLVIGHISTIKQTHPELFI